MVDSPGTGPARTHADKERVAGRSMIIVHPIELIARSGVAHECARRQDTFEVSITAPHRHRVSGPMGATSGVAFQSQIQPPSSRVIGASSTDAVAVAVDVVGIPPRVKSKPQARVASIASAVNRLVRNAALGVYGTPPRVECMNISKY